MPGMERYICIHCHFYQPPRENPWLEAVEIQDSAYPYHDWNERITAECYGPNTASRILDGKGRITQIVNNYSNISFNFGPTLLSWLENNAPEVYEGILQADRDSRFRFSGHGSAIAQAYNHMILPLANRRDRETQVKWGIRDFQERFGREPEGMWLPETAVDVETLEILADNGIRFTILAPHQAKQVRRLHPRAVWRNVEGATIDPTRAYVAKLPGAKHMALFFYDGPISRAVAFEKLLSSGENFAARLMGGFDESRKWSQLMHIATDGETYGHHHPHGDMALAYALHYIESNNLAKITNYGEFLEKNPPQMEAEILEETSWSCAHGIERWRSDCGCSSGRAGWTQAWRGPLRDALDWLRDELTAPYEQKARELLRDPWAARDAYISMVLDRSPEKRYDFFLEHAAHVLSEAELTTALKLLEMQRHLLLMYTSCGWFFDELSGIETVQVVLYAARAIQLAEELFGGSVEEGFLERLAKAKSNLAEYGDGAAIYRMLVRPSTINLLGVTAHFAISSLFGNYGDSTSIYCYDLDVLDRTGREFGRARLGLGHCRVTSQITLDSSDVTYGVLHFGDHNVNAGVRVFRGSTEFATSVESITAAFSTGDLPATLRELDHHFDGITYSLRSLFRDERHRILDLIMQEVLKEAGESYRRVYHLHAPLMQFITDLHIPLPSILRLTGEFVLNGSLREALEAEELDIKRVRTLLDNAEREKIELDAAGLSFSLKNRLAGASAAFLRDARSIDGVEKFASVVKLARSMPFDVSLWKPQNVYYYLLKTMLPDMQSKQDGESREWSTQFIRLGELLRIHVES